MISCSLFEATVTVHVGILVGGMVGERGKLFEVKSKSEFLTIWQCYKVS